MDGGSIPPSSTNTYALTRGYSKKTAGRKPPAPRAQHCRSTALRRLPRCVGFYRISTAGIDSAHDFKAQQALAENSALTRS